MKIEDQKNEDIGIALNKLAREQDKYRLLASIATDLQVCKLEGIEPKEYVKELKDLIDGIYYSFK